MATRTYHKTEALAESTHNSSTFTDHTSGTLTFTPDDSSTYFILWSCVYGQSTNNNTQGNIRLRHDTASATLAEASREPFGQTADIEYSPFAGIVEVSFGASPGSQTFSLEIANETSTHVVRCRDAVLVAIKKGANDQSASSTGTSTSTSTTYVDKGSLSFTPPSTGDYLILGYLEVISSETTNTANVRLLLEDGSTAIATTTHSMVDTQDRTGYSVAYVRSLASGASRTVKMQFNRASGSGTITASKAYIVALRLSDFTDADSAQDTTNRTSTSNSYVARNAASTLTFTPGATVDHLVIGSSHLGADGTSRMAEKFVVDGTDYQERLYRGSTGGDFTAFGLALLELDANSTTIEWQVRRVEASGTLASNHGTVIALALASGATVNGTAAADFGAVTAAAAGGPVEAGAAAADLGGLSATSSGLRTVSGLLAGSLGAQTATATGVRTTSGVAAADLDALGGAAAGTRLTAGTAATAFGVLAAVATGAPQRAGTAAADLGGLGAAAVAVRTVTASAVASLDALTSTATAVDIPDATYPLTTAGYPGARTTAAYPSTRSTSGYPSTRTTGT